MDDREMMDLQRKMDRACRAVLGPPEPDTTRRTERLTVASRVLAGMYANPNPPAITKRRAPQALKEADALLALVDGEEGP